MPLAHLTIRFIFPPFLDIFSEHLDASTPFLTDITTFLEIEHPATRRLERICLISVESSSDIKVGLSRCGIVKRLCEELALTAKFSLQYFSYLNFQSRTVSRLNLYSGYFLSPHLRASGMPYFHAQLATSFLIFPGMACHLILAFASCCTNDCNSLPTQICDDVLGPSGFNACDASLHK